jgi:ubiquitin
MKKTITDTFQKFKNQSVQFGLTVNEQKTKYLRCSKKKNGLNDTDIDSKHNT